MNDKALFLPQPKFPLLTLERVISAYEEARVILEYGSGGSTIVGAEIETVETLISVESDREWAEKLNETLTALYPQRDVSVLHVDIGETGPWGRPKDSSKYEKYPNYPLSVWYRDGFRQPDLVLIDGRFRVACFYATMLMTKAPVTVLFDDYERRKPYHVVERFFQPIAMHDRMAEFLVTPKTLDPAFFLEIVRAFSLPQ